MSALVNRTGKQYGRLVVVRRAPNRGKSGKAHWLCHCTCGNEVVVRGDHLKSGHTMSCGCSQPGKSHVGLIDEKGNCYGQLVVIERVEKNGRRGIARWRCKCSCGNEVVVQGSRLRRGYAKSCGCLKAPPGQAPYNYQYSQYRSGAIRRGYEFKLSKLEIQALIQQPCFYCNASPSQVVAAYDDFVFSGLDRLDNDKGYVADNVVPCCSNCNYAKRFMSVQQFRDWIKAIYHHFIDEAR